MNWKLHSRLLLISTLVFLVQCSPGTFSPSTAPVADNTKSGGGSSGSTTDTDAQHRKDLENTINNSTMSGVVEGFAAKLIDFDRKNGVYLLRIPMQKFGTIIALDMTFPQYPGMHLYLENIGDAPYVTLAIPVKYVLRNVTQVPAKLPNGDRVPLFAAGEPPSNGILLTPNRAQKIYLYLSPEAFGLFAETSWDPSLGGIVNQLALAIRDRVNGSGPIMGYLTTVAKKGDFNGGFFVSYKIDPKLGKVLDEYYLD